MTSLTLETSLTDLNIFILNVNSSRLLGCDTIRFIIQAHNPVGPGETSTITHMNTCKFFIGTQLSLRFQYKIFQGCSFQNLMLGDYKKTNIPLDIVFN